MDMPLEDLHVVDVVCQHHDAALGEHDVVVQVLGKTFPQLDGVIVDAGGLVIEIVGTDDRGIAAGIAAAKPALFQHRDIGDAVFLGKIVGGGEAVAAGADDDDVVGGLRFGAYPLLFPPLVVAQGFAGNGKG